MTLGATNSASGANGGSGRDVIFRLGVVPLNSALEQLRQFAEAVADAQQRIDRLHQSAGVGGGGIPPAPGRMTGLDVPDVPPLPGEPPTATRGGRTRPFTASSGGGRAGRIQDPFSAGMDVVDERERREREREERTEAEYNIRQAERERMAEEKRRRTEETRTRRAEEKARKDAERAERDARRKEASDKRDFDRTLEAEGKGLEPMEGPGTADDPWTVTAEDKFRQDEAKEEIKLRKERREKRRKKREKDAKEYAKTLEEEGKKLDPMSGQGSAADPWTVTADDTARQEESRKTVVNAKKQEASQEQAAKDIEQSVKMANASVTRSRQKAIRAVRGGLKSAVYIFKGMAEMGLASEETSEAILKKFMKIEGMANVAMGMIHAVDSLMRSGARVGSFLDALQNRQQVMAKAAQAAAGAGQRSAAARTAAGAAKAAYDQVPDAFGGTGSALPGMVNVVAGAAGAAAGGDDDGGMVGTAMKAGGWASSAMQSFRLWRLERAAKLAKAAQAVAGAGAAGAGAAGAGAAGAGEAVAGAATAGSWKATAGAAAVPAGLVASALASIYGFTRLFQDVNKYGFGGGATPGSFQERSATTQVGLYSRFAAWQEQLFDPSTARERRKTGQGGIWDRFADYGQRRRVERFDALRNMNLSYDDVVKRVHALRDTSEQRKEYRGLRATAEVAISEEENRLLMIRREMKKELDDMVKTRNMEVESIRRSTEVLQRATETRARETEIKYMAPERTVIARRYGVEAESRALGIEQDRLNSEVMSPEQRRLAQERITERQQQMARDARSVRSDEVRLRGRRETDVLREEVAATDRTRQQTQARMQQLLGRGRVSPTGGTLYSLTGRIQSSEEYAARLKTEGALKGEKPEETQKKVEAENAKAEPLKRELAELEREIAEATEAGKQATEDAIRARERLTEKIRAEREERIKERESNIEGYMKEIEGIRKIQEAREQSLQSSRQRFGSGTIADQYRSQWAATHLRSALQTGVTAQESLRIDQLRKEGGQGSAEEIESIQGRGQARVKSMERARGVMQAAARGEPVRQEDLQQAEAVVRQGYANAMGLLTPQMREELIKQGAAPVLEGEKLRGQQEAGRLGFDEYAGQDDAVLMSRARSRLEEGKKAELGQAAERERGAVREEKAAVAMERGAGGDQVQVLVREMQGLVRAVADARTNAISQTPGKMDVNVSNTVKAEIQMSAGDLDRQLVNSFTPILRDAMSQMDRRTQQVVNEVYDRVRRERGSVRAGQGQTGSAVP